MTRLFILFFSFSFFMAPAQSNMRPVTELIDTRDLGWTIVQKWIDSAINKVEVLPADTVRAKDALFNAQVTTHSPMGSVIYFIGGILIDDGWIRILGSGHKKLNRSVPGWNKGKSFSEFGETPAFLLIADDAVGGFFAINEGRFSKGNVGKVYYLSPDRLTWEPLDLSYTEFLLFCFSGDLAKFYGDMRWENWEKDVLKLRADQVYHFTPPLWSKEGKDIKKSKKKAVPVEEQYQWNMEARKTLKLE